MVLVPGWRAAAFSRMNSRFKSVDSGVSHLYDVRGSRGILYQCRMQYLKSREGGSRSKTRRKSTDVRQEQVFPVLDERTHAPCSSHILLPPNELMTRNQAFSFEWWKHHKEPTMRSCKKLDFGHDEKNERLSKKRREILLRMEATAKARKESELRQRAERVMNQQTSLESMEEDDESESELTISRMPQLPSHDEEKAGMSPLTSSSNRRIGPRSSIMGGARSKTALPPISRRSTMRKSDDSSSKENTKDSAFSFLEEWNTTSKKDSKQNIRW